jgi:hypothetical protein
MSPKLAIVVLVLLVVLLVVGLGAGACSGQGTAADARPGVLGALLGGALVKPLDLTTVAASPASCISGQQVVVPLNQTCELTVPKEGPASRRLQLVQGVVLVTFTPADPNFMDKGGPQPHTFPDSQTSNVDVISSGGVLDVRCQGGGSLCVLRSAS